MKRVVLRTTGILTIDNVHVISFGLQQPGMIWVLGSEKLMNGRAFPGQFDSFQFSAVQNFIAVDVKLEGLRDILDAAH